MCPLLHLADNPTTRVCLLLDQSGQRWVLAEDGLSAYDPKRTLSPGAFI